MNRLSSDRTRQRDFFGADILDAAPKDDTDSMIQNRQESLKRLASKYIWWKTPEEAMDMPARAIAQVMNIGDYSDVQELVSQVGEGALCEVLRRAEAGQFNARSWAYWHYRLGLSSVDQVPALPVRKFA